MVVRGNLTKDERACTGEVSRVLLQSSQYIQRKFYLDQRATNRLAEVEKTSKSCPDKKRKFTGLACPINIRSQRRYKATSQKCSIDVLLLAARSWVLFFNVHLVGDGLLGRPDTVPALDSDYLEVQCTKIHTMRFPGVDVVCNGYCAA